MTTGQLTALLLVAGAGLLLGVLLSVRSGQRTRAAAAARRAASTIACARSDRITRPSPERAAATARPTSPGPDASSSTVTPGSSARCSISHAVMGAPMARTRSASDSQPAAACSQLRALRLRYSSAATRLVAS